MRSYLALVACIAVSGSIADAKPRHRHRRHVAVVEDDTVVDTPVRLHERAAAREDWHLAIGPDVWASSVDAKVSLGSQTVSTGIDFIQMEHHARYGVPLLGEMRFGRFSFVGDFMYGVVDINGSKDVGPVMVTLNGTASSLMFDGLAGYRLLGGEQSVLAVEARGGVRYQRTAIAGAVDVGGSPAISQEQIDDGADGLAGARVLVRPASWLSVAGAFDVGVVGSSTSTWSASADASVRIGSRVLLSLGYRTMTMDRGYMSMVMHGPRAALQLLF